MMTTGQRRQQEPASERYPACRRNGVGERRKKEEREEHHHRAGQQRHPEHQSGRRQHHRGPPSPQRPQQRGERGGEEQHEHVLGQDVGRVHQEVRDDRRDDGRRQRVAPVQSGGGQRQQEDRQPVDEGLADRDGGECGVVEQDHHAGDEIRVERHPVRDRRQGHRVGAGVDIGELAGRDQGFGDVDVFLGIAAVVERTVEAEHAELVDDPDEDRGNHDDQDAPVHHAASRATMSRNRSTKAVRPPPSLMWSK